ncbi:MAG: flagellar biosynthetic protein FliQ [Myxococcales bacterium]|nr:flagellar biosynthetic protein FliQ [Myxococcales bacterium]
MTIDQSISLMTELIETSIWVGGPVLGAALVGGVLIGVLQTATQIQEQSVGFVVKAACVLLVFFMGGTALASKTVKFTRDHFDRIGDVVR